MSTLAGHQSLTLPQKIDSRGGSFWCKKGLAVNVGKMNIYLKGLPFAPVLGLFGAKCKTKSINIHSFCINKTFKNHEIHG